MEQNILQDNGLLQMQEEHGKAKALWKINGRVQLGFFLLQSTQLWSCDNGLSFQIIDVDLIILSNGGWHRSYLLCHCRPSVFRVPLKRKALWISVPGFHKTFCHTYCDCYSLYLPCGVNQGELVFVLSKGERCESLMFLGGKCKYWHFSNYRSGNLVQLNKGNEAF